MRRVRGRVAIYHFSGQVLGRTGRLTEQGMKRPGSKVVAAAAYRAGARLTDRSRGEVHDYSRRKGVAHAEIMTPPGSAAWLADRELLWSAVEALEVRKDAQLAREFNMALPHELGAVERLQLVRDFVASQFVTRGMVADIALHDPIRELGQDMRNVHAHVLLTMRRATATGLDRVKTREWNSRELLATWRTAWADACNRALERVGQRARIDHRSLEVQRERAREAGDLARAMMLDRRPEIHVGPQARQILRHGRIPVSRVREMGSFRATAVRAPAQRRRRDYTAIDQGPRLTFMKSIIARNNRDLKRSLADIDRRVDQFHRRLDYWERRATFGSDGIIRSVGIRPFGRQISPADGENREVAAHRAHHARHRAVQIRELLKLLYQARGVNRFVRERTLIREREVRAWLNTALRSHARRPLYRDRVSSPF